MQTETMAAPEGGESGELGLVYRKLGKGEGAKNRARLSNISIGISVVS